jgi:hypothetical protein
LPVGEALTRRALDRTQGAFRVTDSQGNPVAVTEIELVQITLQML